MNFGGSRRHDDDLEINLIPLIDVLLVMLIFLAATTTFTRQTQLRVSLPQAQSQESAPRSLDIAVSSDGRYALNGVLISAPDTAAIAQALRQAVGDAQEPVLVINADAQATHQSVVNVMEAARMAGISRINFAAQKSP
jgi:biopolymer transport protein ExbD